MIFKTVSIRTVIFKEVNHVKRHLVRDMHSFTLAGFLMYLFRNDFVPGCLMLPFNDVL